MEEAPRSGGQEDLLPAPVLASRSCTAAVGGKCRGWASSSAMTSSHAVIFVLDWTPSAELPQVAMGAGQGAWIRRLEVRQDVGVAAEDAPQSGEVEPGGTRT
jgi:hypothetical protein